MNRAHDILWKISNLQVLLDGLIEFLKFLIKSLPFSRFLERMESSGDTLSLLGVESILPSLLVGSSPGGFFELLVLVSNIIELVANHIEVIILNMDTVWSFSDSLLKSFTEIGPLLNKFLSFWRGKELFVKLFKSMNLWGVSPSFKRSSHVSEWSSLLNFLPGGSNIIGFLLDGSLSFLCDLDLKHVCHIFW